MATESERNALITRIVYAHQASVLRLAFAYVKNTQDAEDIAQDVFMAFMKASPTLAGAEHEKAYLIRATVNRCKGHLLSGWVRRRRPMPEAFARSEAGGEGVLQYVMALDEKYRIPIHLHYYEGYTIAEIGEMIGAKPSTVGTRLARGREALKAAIGGMEDV